MSFPKYPEYKESGVEILATVPFHWKILFMKRFAQLAYGDALPTDVRDNDGQIPVYGSNGVVGIHSATNTTSPVILVGRKGSYGALNWSCQPVFAIDTVYFIDENHCAANLRWLFWTLHIADFSGCSQDTGVPGLSRSLAHNTYLPLPSLQEQSAIAAFLDRETAKIDALVAEQEKLIELLKEKRQAVISHTVTKGLDPNVPMKDSGVEWLGEVPEHWELTQLKYVVALGSVITYGIVQAGPHVENGVPYIKTSDMSGDSLPLDGYSKTSFEIDKSYSRSKVSPGDIVVAIRATVGKCLLVPEELDGANLTQGTAKVSSGTSMLNLFLLHQMNSLSAQTYFDLMAKGATFQEITLDALRRTPITVPPLEEQKQIIVFLEGKLCLFDDLQREAQSTIDLLKERRSALISATVTGKIDVRGLAVATQ